MYFKTIYVYYPDSQPNTHAHCSWILSEDAVLSPTQSALKPWSTTLEASTLTKHKQYYLQMFSTYKNNLYKNLNIKVYYRLNVFWDQICSSLHVEGNVLNGSLKFTKYNKRIIGFVHRLFKFFQKDENKVP
jgi:hypothetical protein